MSEQEKIDLQKLSQKELLIVTYRELKELNGEVKQLSEVQNQHAVKIAVIETRVKMWGAVYGTVAGVAIQLIIALINVLTK